MSDRKLNVEFANFVCHFGDAELLAYFDEIVYPAFFSGLKRKFGKSKYFIHRPELVSLPKIDGQSNPAIVGRFVIDTEISREQIFQNGRIVEDKASMRTAPSSLFVLTLRDHKLFYVKEVPKAPGLSAFRSTVERLMADTRSAYIRALYLQLRKESDENPNMPKVTLKTLTESIPPPSLNIVPLSSVSSMSGFLNQFSKLKEVRVKMITPNSEIDNEGIFNGVREVKDAMNAETATITYRNNDEGLDVKVAKKHVGPAARGNAEIVFAGDGQDGKVLRGNNDDFKISIPIPPLPAELLGIGKFLFKKFSELVATGSISIAQPGSAKFSGKINEIDKRI